MPLKRSTAVALLTKPAVLVRNVGWDEWCGTDTHVVSTGVHKDMGDEFCTSKIGFLTPCHVPAIF